MARGRRPATAESEDRVRRLVAVLTSQRLELDLSVGQVSERSGVSYETVRTLLAPPNPERRRQSPSFFVVADVARVLGVSLKGLEETCR